MNTLENDSNIIAKILFIDLLYYLLIHAHKEIVTNFIFYQIIMRNRIIQLQNLFFSRAKRLKWFPCPLEENVMLVDLRFAVVCIKLWAGESAHTRCVCVCCIETGAHSSDFGKAQNKALRSRHIDEPRSAPALATCKSQRKTLKETNFALESAKKDELAI